MADNTTVTPGVGESIRDKDRAGVKTQIVGLDLGIGTGTESLMSGALPVINSDVAASGNITTQNLVPAGVATAASAVAVSTDNAALVGIQVSGVYTGALSVQATLDDTNWITITALAILNLAAETSAATIASAATGLYAVDVAGLKQIRVTALAAVTGTATITLRASARKQIAQEKIGAYGDQVHSLSHPSTLIAGIYAGVTGYGYLRTSDEAKALFSDPFDGGVFDAAKWATTGSTVVPTAASGKASMAQGAALSAASALLSVPTFTGQGVNFLGVGFVANFETINSTAGTLFYLNSHRFLGLGSVPASWVSAYTASAATGPLLDAIGFEIDVDGKMYPVVYVNGTRTRPALLLGGADLNTGNGTASTGGSRALADGALHQFAIVIRADVVFWYVDGTDLPVALYRYSTAGYAPPNVQTLPLRFHAINGTGSAPSGTMVTQVGAIGVGDTGKNSSQISDGTYPWRKLQVDANGRAAVTHRSAALTVTTGSITSAASVVTASTDISSAGSVTVSLSGTYAGVNVSFEASLDGIVWFGILGQRTDSYITEITTGVLTANLTRAWDVPLPGPVQFRVRATAWSSGTAAVAIMPAVNPFEVAPTVGFSTTANAPAKTNAALSVTSFTVLAANTSRRMAMFFNDSNNVVYLDLSGGSATTSSYSLQLTPGAYYELPVPVYSGLITAIALVATGNVRVTELT